MEALLINALAFAPTTEGPIRLRERYARAKAKGAKRRRPQDAAKGAAGADGGDGQGAGGVEEDGGAGAGGAGGAGAAGQGQTLGSGGSGGSGGAQGPVRREEGDSALAPRTHTHSADSGGGEAAGAEGSGGYSNSYPAAKRLRLSEPQPRLALPRDFSRVLPQPPPPPSAPP